MTEPGKKPPTSPATGAFAAGLLAALAASFLGPRVWDAMETSQARTAGVMLGAFVLAATLTYFAMRERAP